MRKKPKAIVVTNMTDLYRIVTSENIDYLSADIRKYLEFFVTMKDDLIKNGQNPLILGNHSMKWIDDGRNEINKIEIKL